MKKAWDVKKLVGLALLTAIVVVLQIVGSAIKIGMFSLSFVLVPIVVGAAMFGPAAGGYLGGVFGLIVLLSGDAGAFMTVSVLGTIITVMVKGICAGLAAGAVYKLFAKKNRYIAIMLAAVTCPVVNTGIFLLGCLAFFMPTIRMWAGTLGFGANASKYMIVGLVGWNFVIELGINIVLGPIILRIINIREKNVR